MSAVGYLVLTADPTTAGGVAAPIGQRGSFSGVTWEKVGTSDTAWQIVPDATIDAVASLLVVRRAFTAATPGTADDVTVFNANAPFLFRILDARLLVSTAIALSTARLRSATGGGGSTLSDLWATSVAGVVVNALLTATPTVAKGGTVALRRSDRGIAGEVILTIARE